MKIGNIIYEDDLVNHDKSNYINYYNETIQYNKIDNTLPTLYVGWSFMKMCNPNNNIIQNADILKKDIIKNKLYWELSFKEGKSSHVKGIDLFTNLVPQYYFSPKYEYIDIDPVFFQIKNIDDLMNICPVNLDISYNYKNEMIYLLSDNKILGINLKLHEFFSFNVNEILNKLKLRTNDITIDLDGTIYQFYYKIFPNFQNVRRYIVTILSK